MKRNWRRGIIGGLSFTSALFVFQACYGMPQDYYPELSFSGQVKSKKTGEPIQGIKVTLKEINWADYTNENGEFFLLTQVVHEATLRFEDVDSSAYGSYASKDTLLVDPAEDNVLEIELEEK